MKKAILTTAEENSPKRKWRENNEVFSTEIYLRREMACTFKYRREETLLPQYQSSGSILEMQRNLNLKRRNEAIRKLREEEENTASRKLGYNESVAAAKKAQSCWKLWHLKRMQKHSRKRGSSSCVLSQPTKCGWLAAASLRRAYFRREIYVHIREIQKCREEASLSLYFLKLEMAEILYLSIYLNVISILKLYIS